jgi:hypothetical protein
LWTLSFETYSFLNIKNLPKKRNADMKQIMSFMKSITSWNLVHTLKQFIIGYNDQKFFSINFFASQYSHYKDLLLSLKFLVFVQSNDFDDLDKNISFKIIRYLCKYMKVNNWKNVLGLNKMIFKAVSCLSLMKTIKYERFFI